MFVAKNGRVSSEEVAVGQGFDCQRTRKKPHFTYPNPHFTYPKPHFTYPKPQASALPRTGNTITAMQKQYYRSAEMKCPAAVIYKNYDVNNILVLRNAFEKTRKQIYATVQHRQILQSATFEICASLNHAAEVSTDKSMTI